MAARRLLRGSVCVAVYGSGSKAGEGHRRPSGGGKPSLKQCQDAMGIDWTEDLGSIHEAIPPAYTQWVGERFLNETARFEVLPLWA